MTKQIETVYYNLDGFYAVFLDREILAVFRWHDDAQVFASRIKGARIQNLEHINRTHG